MGIKKIVKQLGELAWPGRYGPEHYEDHRTRDERAFMAQFEGDTVSDAVTMCPESAWHHYDDLPECAFAVIAVDTASTVHTKSDFTGMMALARAKDGRAPILEYRQGKWEFEEIVREIYFFYEHVGRMLGGRNNPEIQQLVRMVNIESAGVGPALRRLIQMNGARDPNVFIPTGLEPAKQSKKFRAQPVATQIKRGHIIIPRETEFTELVKKQWFTLGMPGAHDEAVDTLSLAYNTLCAEDNLFGHFPIGIGSPSPDDGTPPGFWALPEGVGGMGDDDCALNDFFKDEPGEF